MILRIQSMALAFSLALGLLFILFVSQAHAAKPNRQACVGEQVSSEAKEFGSDLGAEVSALAKSNTGVGSLIQELQAGNVPDTACE